MKTFVKVKLQVEGVHCWEGCNIAEVMFLKHPHRHVFYITCCKEVSHDDRDIEIIMFKQLVERYLISKYYNGRFCDFQSKSCEMLAQELVSEFGLAMCEVLEDNENGALVQA